ncbi:MAG: ArsR/SmtB family transcription factor [Thermoguttaceae bacterium]
MDQHTQARYAARARLIKAVAHPTRLFVVEELCRHGKRSVHELTNMVGADMSTVSRHLSVLKTAGIVQDEKAGAHVHYRLAMQCILGFIQCVDTMVRQRAQRERKLLGV